MVKIGYINSAYDSQTTLKKEQESSEFFHTCGLWHVGREGCQHWGWVKIIVTR
jgi:hypothetical protein